MERRLPLPYCLLMVSAAARRNAWRVAVALAVAPSAAACTLALAGGAAAGAIGAAGASSDSSLSCSSSYSRGADLEPKAAAAASPEASDLLSRSVVGNSLLQSRHSVVKGVHHDSASWSISSSLVAISIITDQWKEPFATRAESVHTTWAPYFEAFAAFSFNKTLSDWATHVDPYGPEENYRGLHLASIPLMVERAPDAKWFVVADDDTWIVPHQLAAALAPLDPEQPILAGKCVLYNNVPFAVGGAGAVLSRRLARDLAPLARDCRERYHKYPYGDAMIGACIKFVLYGQPGDEETLGLLHSGYQPHRERLAATEVEREVVRCLPGSTNDDVELVDEQWVKERKDQLPVSLHIKDTGVFKHLWSSMQPSIDEKRSVKWGDVLVARDAALAASNHHAKASFVRGLSKNDDEETTGLYRCRPVLGTAAQSWWEVCS